MRRRDRRPEQTAAVNEIVVLLHRVIYRILMNCVCCYKTSIGIEVTVYTVLHIYASS